MTRKNHSIEFGKDILAYGFMSALSQMSGLLLLPILTRIYSVNEYGVVDIVATFISLVTTLIKCALPNAIVRYFRQKSESEDVRYFISTLLGFTLCLGLMAIAFLTFFSDFLAQTIFNDVESKEYIVFGCWISFFLGISGIPMMVLRMERRIVAYNLVNVLSTISYLVLALYFVLLLKSGVEGIFVAQLLIGALTLLISLVMIRKYLTPYLSIKELKLALKYSLPMFPGRLIVWINAQADRLLLLMFLGLGGVAIFGAAARIAKIPQFLLSVFRQAWQPYSMLILDSDDRMIVYRRMLNYYAGVFSIIGIICTAFSPEVFEIFLPADYHMGYMIIPWFLGAEFLHGSAVFTNLGMMISEKTIGISAASSAGIILNILIALVLIKIFGVVGAAIGHFVSEFIYTCLLWRFSEEKHAIRFDLKSIIRVIFIYIIGAILLLIVSHEVVKPISLYCRLILAPLIVFLIGYQIFDRSVIGTIKQLFNELQSGRIASKQNLNI